MEKQTIPSSVIGVVGDIYQSCYTMAELKNIFLKANVPENIFMTHYYDSKLKSITRWFGNINFSCEEPLKILGKLLKGFMEQEFPVYHDSYDSYNQQNERKIKIKKEINQINQSLAENNLRYAIGGDIVPTDLLPALHLLENISQSQYLSITNEVTSARKNIEEKKYREALVNAGSLLEAACKRYLTHKNLDFNNGDALYNLWKKTKIHLGDDEMHESLTEGLNDVATGVRKLRNEKSNAHGQTEEQARQDRIDARTAQLAVNSSITLSFYILKHLE